MNGPGLKVHQMLQKIRTLSKECEMCSLTSKIPGYQNPRFELVLEEYLRALDELRVKFYELHEVVEEYKKLEEVLQKNETEIRKHVGIEQQLKLYIDTLKAQYEESESDRLELLLNSKAMIKSLKSENEQLLHKLRQLEKCSHKKVGVCERAKTDNPDQSRGAGEREFTSPYKKRKNVPIADFKVELTERRIKESGHKKKMLQLKKNKLHSWTFLAYSNPRKYQSREKSSSHKKNMTALNQGKKVSAASGFKSQNRSRNRVNQSVFSLPEGEGETAQHLSHQMQFQKLPNNKTYHLSPGDLDQTK